MNSVEDNTMARQLSNLLVVEKAQADDKKLGESEENTDQLEGDEKISDMKFTNYKDESQLDYVMTLVGRDLSEPYSSEFYVSIIYLVHHKRFLSKSL